MRRPVQGERTTAQRTTTHSGGLLQRQSRIIICLKLGITINQSSSQETLWSGADTLLLVPSLSPITIVPFFATEVRTSAICELGDFSRCSNSFLFLFLANLLLDYFFILLHIFSYASLSRRDDGERTKRNRWWRPDRWRIVRMQFKTIYVSWEGEKRISWLYLSGSIVSRFHGLLYRFIESTMCRGHRDSGLCQDLIVTPVDGLDGLIPFSELLKPENNCI